MSFYDSRYWLPVEKTVALDLCFANTAEGLLSRQTLENFTGALSDVTGLLCLSYPLVFLILWKTKEQCVTVS